MHPGPLNTLSETVGSIITRLEECNDGSFRVYQARVTGAGEHPYPPNYYSDRAEALKQYAYAIWRVRNHN